MQQMDPIRNLQSQTRTTQSDASSGSRQDNADPGPSSGVLFREIHKNAWLRKLCPEKKLGAYPKKGERVWIVFCVHDDSEAFLELYYDQKMAVTHNPDWLVSLQNCLHVSPTICPQEEEYEFVVTLSSDVIRLAAPSWELMMEWVEVIRSKLREMHILSPKENLYSKLPENRLPLAPTRDPNSPLPPPPLGPSAVVPGVEGTQPEPSVGRPEESAIVTESLPEATVPNTRNTSINTEQRARTSAVTTSLYISQSEPPVYTRPRHILNRAASVPDSPSRLTGSSDADNNVTVIEVSSERVPYSAVPLDYQGVFNFSFVDESLSSLPESNSGLESIQLPASRERNNQTNDTHYTAPNTEVSAADTISTAINVQGILNSDSRNSSPSRAVDINRSHYECVFLPHSAIASNTNAEHSPRQRRVTNDLVNESNPSPHSVRSNGATQNNTANNVAESMLVQRDDNSGGHVQRHRYRSLSTSETPSQIARPQQHLVGDRSLNTPVDSPRTVESERRLQPAPHPYRQGNSTPTSRLTLREQQVLQLRREMIHPGGVRLQLRRKDCNGCIALVDAFGAVWIAGWKQREHPMLYNALHIGDQVISTAGVRVQSAADANKLLRSATGLYVEIVILRVPFGRVLAIRRDSEGQNLGILQEGNTAEIRDVIPGSPAARHGLTPRAQSCDGLSLTNWVLTEINGRPLNLFFKDGEVRDRLNAVGREISILVQPFDLVKQLKKQLKALRSYKDYIVQ